MGEIIHMGVCRYQSPILQLYVWSFASPTLSFSWSHSSSADVSSTRSEWQDNNLMKMASSNILTRKQIEKMANDQLIESAMKLQNNMINKQTELINNNKEFREKLIKKRLQI